MNPALSPHTTGFLPRVCTSEETSLRTLGSVTTVWTISTKPCTGAGLKKCTPITRPGLALDVEISVTDSEEVFVARIVSSETIASSSLKICFLICTDSTTASTTRSASLSSSSEVAKLTRSSSAFCSSSLSFPRATARDVEVSRCCRPRLTASSSISTPTTE